MCVWKAFAKSMRKYKILQGNECRPGADYWVDVADWISKRRRYWHFSFECCEMAALCLPGLLFCQVCPTMHADPSQPQDPGESRWNMPPGECNHSRYSWVELNCAHINSPRKGTCGLPPSARIVTPTWGLAGPCLLMSWIPWNLSFRYIHCTGQFTPKMKANAVLHLLLSLVWIDQYDDM